jgi:outer membrane receptor protein involved in Fe transport
VVSASEAILGRVAGVQVTQNSGRAGRRNFRSHPRYCFLTSGSDPLIVVDGIPMSVNFRAINPNDIESIDVLKDAAACCYLWFPCLCRCILITTKRGKAGKVALM